MVTIVVPPAYGYVVLTAISSAFMLVYLGVKVGQARRTYNVPYPTMYASDEKGKIFNCVQRGHQNTLENYTQFLMLLLLGGVKHPEISAIAGLVWIISRFFYAAGYATGDPAKRSQGAFGYIGLLTLIGCAVSFALSLLGHL